jgi:CDP-paratose 2-epimerase
MDFKRVLITGGAGFVGSSYAIWLAKRQPGVTVVAADNLKRRGSELNLPRLRANGVHFVHADVRNPEDIHLDHLKPELVIDCSAEPSVLAAFESGSDYVIRTNLSGTVNCLELARRCHSAFLFLSTSRVYPIAALNRIDFLETSTRFEWVAEQHIPGVTADGISEQFTLDGARSLYGATKLAAELLLHEYGDMYRMPFVINRCGVIAGPWQMGKVDQGVVALWVAAHRLKMPLSYIGWGGQGKQLRDILFIDDLCELLDLQLSRLSEISGSVFNIGGGLRGSASLMELTSHCAAITGTKLQFASEPGNRAGDVRVYRTDNARITDRLGWRPSTSVEEIVLSIDKWLCDHPSILRSLSNQPA